jgi:hypothetical protein
MFRLQKISHRNTDPVLSASKAMMIKNMFKVTCQFKRISVSEYLITKEFLPLQFPHQHC